MNKTAMKRLAFGAMLTALSVLIGLFCKSYLTFGAIRITFDNLPVLLAGIILGPVYGGVVGMTADLVTAPITGSVNPFITLGAASVGFIAGIIGRYILKERSFVKLLITVIPAHIVGNMMIKSFGLWYFYGYPIPMCLARIPLYLAIGLAETYIIYIILKNRQLMNSFGSKR